MAQEIQHDEIVVNIEVPVRVFDGNRFVDDLTIEDFEVFENGKPQKITACYLIKKTKIERKEEKEASPSPDVSRNFILLFDIWEYFPKVEKAIDLFFEEVILPGDSLMVLTPVKAYNLKNIAWIYEDKQDLAEQLKNKVRKDAVMGNAEYRNTLRELEEITKEMNTLVGIKSSISSYDPLGQESPIDFLDYRLQKYQEGLFRLRNLRAVEQQKITNFAKLLKERSGQKIAFLFSQREMVAQPSDKILSIFDSEFQFERPDLPLKLNELFASYSRDVSINTENIKKAFSDSSILIHFLYITKVIETAEGIQYREQSEDIYKAFSEVAKSTGGLIESSANAEASMQKAVMASENYYLLYYRPSEYKRDGEFKNIRIKVKTGSYRVTHRSGYIAN
jgi:VWFA-related protein